MEQQTGSKLGKEYVKAVYCHLAFLASIQSISCKILGWMTHKLESRLPRKISTASDIQITDDSSLMAESEEELKTLLMKVKEYSENAGLNSAFKKLRSWHRVPSLHDK